RHAQGPARREVHVRGTAEEIADAQREKGNQNRDAVHRALCAAGVSQGPGEVHVALKARDVEMAVDTVSKHLRALAKAGKASVIGKGSATRYLGIPDAPSSVISRDHSESLFETRS